MQRAAGEAYAATRRACRVFHAAWSEPHSRQRSPVQGLARRSSSNPGGGSAPVVFPSAAASRRRHISRTCSFLIPVNTCASPRCRVASTEEPSTLIHPNRMRAGCKAAFHEQRRRQSCHPTCHVRVHRRITVARCAAAVGLPSRRICSAPHGWAASAPPHPRTTSGRRA